MGILKIVVAFILLLAANVCDAQTQLRFKVISGQISLDDFAPTEKKYESVSESLNRDLKSNPNDTTKLFYRALIYLQFNRFIVKPGLISNEPMENLLTAKKMVDRADSLKMKSFGLKVLRAQLYKELTNRYAPIETWRFNATQMADRKRKFDYYKDLANRYYDELAEIDKSNAYDYRRLKAN